MDEWTGFLQNGSHSQILSASLESSPGSAAVCKHRRLLAVSSPVLRDLEDGKTTRNEEQNAQDKNH